MSDFYSQLFERNRMLHLGIVPGGPFNPDDLQVPLVLAHDWFRYAPNCFLIWTNKSAEQWAEQLRLSPALSRHAFLICAVDMSDRQGWLPQAAWQWIDKYSSLSRNALLEALANYDKKP